MKFTTHEISQMLDGIVEGNSNITLNKLTKIQEGCKNGLSFLANLKYKEHLYSTEASAVIIDKDLILEKEVKVTLIRVDNAYNSFARLLRIIENLQKKDSEIENLSYIDKSAKIGKDIYVGAFTYIGKNVSIGNNVKIYPHCYIGQNVTINNGCTLYSGVKIYHDCQIEQNCTVHSGAVIGADGFGFAPNSENAFDKIPQIGNVVIHEEVEIGANTCIDRATLGSTVIHRGVKLDNMIQIAHNVEVGKNTVIASQTAVAGSSKIGENCMIGGHVAIAGHLVIADNVKIAGKSGISKNITKKGRVLQGNLAFDIKDFQRSYVYFRQLPSWNKRIIDLEKKLQ
jgi:UDP-3-O-[3-hydroxymyristoyl] glucosamine N-acyltransferase